MNFCKLKLIFYMVAIAYLAMSCNTKVQESEDEKPPNILFIMSDDHAYQAISAYGHGLNETPNIDRIANEGAIFTRATVTNSICAPSRAVLLTISLSYYKPMGIKPLLLEKSTWMDCLRVLIILWFCPVRAIIITRTFW